MSRTFYLLFPPQKLPEPPQIGEHVSIEGQPGVYIVLRLDTKRFAADLMLTTGNHALEENVPYFAIERITLKAGKQDQKLTETTRGDRAV